MNSIVAILLWALASVGSYDACDRLAVSVGSDEAAVCVAPPPEEGAEADPAPERVLVAPPRRRISNGF
jgi:hypothetical protein